MLTDPLQISLYETGKEHAIYLGIPGLFAPEQNRTMHPAPAKRQNLLWLSWQQASGNSTVAT